MSQLTEILIKLGGEYSDVTEELLDWSRIEIAEAEAAINKYISEKESVAHKAGYIEGFEVAQANISENYKTGQEWLDAFELACNGRVNITPNIWQAAQKAAGITVDGEKK